MAMNSTRESAKIYQFPKNPRVPLGNYSADTNGVIDYNSIAAAALDSAWYHDDAIAADSEPLGKH